MDDVADVRVIEVSYPDVEQEGDDIHFHRTKLYSPQGNVTARHFDGEEILVEMERIKNEICN